MDNNNRNENEAKRANENANRTNGSDRANENKTMTHSQAGHMGGEAHHKCRGRECDKK